MNNPERLFSQIFKRNKKKIGIFQEKLDFGSNLSDDYSLWESHAKKEKNKRARLEFASI